MECRFFIQDVFRITGIGAVPFGNVTRGTLRAGMWLNIGGRSMRLKSMEMRHRKIQEARTGDNVGLVLENADYNILKRHARQEVMLSGHGEGPGMQAPEGVGERKGIISRLLGR